MNESLLSAILLSSIGAVLGGIGYCIKTVWRHDRDLTALYSRITHIEANCVKEQSWQIAHAKKVDHIAEMLVKIAAKMDVDVDDNI